MNDDQIKNLLKEVTIPQELPSQLRAIMSSADKFNHSLDHSATDTDQPILIGDDELNANYKITNRLSGRPFWLQPLVLIGLGAAAAIWVALFVWFPRPKINPIANHSSSESQVSGSLFPGATGREDRAQHGTETSLNDQQELELLQARIDAIHAELLEAELREMEDRRAKLVREKAGRRIGDFERTLLATALSHKSAHQDLGVLSICLENELLTGVIEQFREGAALTVVRGAAN